MASYKVDNKRGDGVIREDEIYDWITNKANASLCGYETKPFEFVRKIQRSVELYLGFIQGRGNDDRDNISVATLRHMTGGAFSLHFVLMLAAAPLSPQLFGHFVRQLESFLYVYIFTKLPTKDLERSFSSWADELRAITQEQSPEQQVVSLNLFIEQRFKQNAEKKRNQLEDGLKRFTLGSMQQYRTRYLLAKLAQHIDMAYQGVRTPDRIDSWRTMEIEHILPNNPSAELKAKFEGKPEDEDSEESEAPTIKYDEWKNRLGNLTLLEKPINIVASNDFYEQKAPLYEQSSVYMTRSLVKLAEVGSNSSITRINAKLKAYEKWDSSSIEERQELLIELAKEVWKITPVEA